MPDEKALEAEVLSEEVDKALAKPVRQTQLVVVDESEYSSIMDTAKFTQLQRVAQLFANTQMVPAHFQKRPADVFVVMQMAMRMRIDPLLALQKMYMVKGTPGLKAELVIALINANGGFDADLDWNITGKGQDMTCKAFAFKKGIEKHATVDMGMVKRFGWDRNPMWQNMPEQMLVYRSSAFFMRRHCPGVAMGLYTDDELRDIHDSGGTFEPITGATDRRKRSNVEMLRDAAKKAQADAEADRGLDSRGTAPGFVQQLNETEAQADSKPPEKPPEAKQEQSHEPAPEELQEAPSGSKSVDFEWCKKVAYQAQVPEKEFWGMVKDSALEAQDKRTHTEKRLKLLLDKIDDWAAQQ